MEDGRWRQDGGNWTGGGINWFEMVGRACVCVEGDAKTGGALFGKRPLAACTIVVAGTQYGRNGVGLPPRNPSSVPNASLHSLQL